MSRSDAMIVGLRLLGASFIILGLSWIGSAIPIWNWSVSVQEGGVAGGYIKYEAHREMIRGGVTAVGGLLLLILSAFKWN